MKTPDPVTTPIAALSKVWACKMCRGSLSNPDFVEFCPYCGSPKDGSLPATVQRKQREMADDANTLLVDAYSDIWDSLQAAESALGHGEDGAFDHLTDAMDAWRTLAAIMGWARP